MNRSSPSRCHFRTVSLSFGDHPVPAKQVRSQHLCLCTLRLRMRLGDLWPLRSELAIGTLSTTCRRRFLLSPRVVGWLLASIVCLFTLRAFEVTMVSHCSREARYRMYPGGLQPGSNWSRDSLHAATRWLL